jgi:hypothetical protein
VSRQADCGIPEARARAKIARKYLEMAELAQTEDLSEAKNVAAGNAVLAGIAASDAICCTRLRRRHRGQDHVGAVTLLRTIHPEGRKLADALTTVLAIKDPAHYGIAFVTDAKLRTTLRAATQLVEAAELIVASG